MSQDQAADARERLEALLASGSLARSAASAGAALKERLDAPVRVTLFGLPGSGRARVVNLIAGEKVLPEDHRMPTLALRHGGVARTVATLADGSQTTWTGLPIDRVDATGPAYLDITQPLAGLRDFTLMQIDADEAAEDQVASMHWAADKTDISLWISRGFAPGEAGLWFRAPEALKHNAYLVLTEAPAAEAPTVAFRRTFQVEPGARQAPDLLAELARCAAQGRESYTDHILMFLARYEARRVSQLRPAAPVVDLAAERVRTEQVRATTRPLTRPITRPLTRPLTTPVAEPVAEAPAVKSRPRIDPTLIPAEALAYLRQRATELDDLLETLAESPEHRVLTFCLETIETLVEKVSAADEPDPAAADVEEMVLEAADVIMLLQSEDGLEPATDAITLLLQLRRELEARIAA